MLLVLLVLDVLLLDVLVLLELVEVLVLPAPEVDVLEALLDEVLVLPLVDPLVLELAAPPVPPLDEVDEALVLDAPPAPPAPGAVAWPRSQPAETRPSVASHRESARENETGPRGFRIMHPPASREPARILFTMLVPTPRSKSKDRRSNLVTFPMPLN